MKPSLAVQFLSPAFAAAVASSSSVSVTEEVTKTKKYDNHRDIHAAAASRAVPSPSRNLDSIHTTSKSSKSSSVSCPPKPTPDVQCGSTYVDSTVILGENLSLISCNGNITQADGSNNAVLLLKGEKALLDCKGHTISQTTDGSAAAMDCDTLADAGDAASILAMKKECDLFFVAGVRLEDGATMRNCNIQKFYLGGDVRDGGQIEDSEFSLNWLGVQISNRAANTVSKISNSETYNNYDGLDAIQNENDSSKIVIQDVISKNNLKYGIRLLGTGITVENAIIKNTNDGAGLLIGPLSESEITLSVSDITLDGDITTANNKFGFATAFAKGSVHVTGNLNSKHNKYGVVTLYPVPDLTVAVGGSNSNSGKSGKSVGSGSLTSCDNWRLDIANQGGITFEGTDYTCDNGKTDGPAPDCKPCYPGCSSSDSDNGSDRSLGLSDFVAGDLDFADMDHGEFLF